MRFLLEWLFRIVYLYRLAGVDGKAKTPEQPEQAEIRLVEVIMSTLYHVQINTNPTLY